MTPNVVNGIMLILAIAAIVAGVALRWGAGWALMVFGVLLLLRLVGPFVLAILTNRENTDG